MNKQSLLKKRLYTLMKRHQQQNDADFPFLVIDEKNWIKCTYQQPINGEKVLAATDLDVHMAIFKNGDFFYEMSDAKCENVISWCKRPIHPDVSTQMKTLLNHGLNVENIGKG
jgi:hypothetical protein